MRKLRSKDIRHLARKYQREDWNIDREPFKGGV